LLTARCDASRSSRPVISMTSPALEAVSKLPGGGLNLGDSEESQHSPNPGALDVDPRDPGRA
jgi:hypothetical protein